ncbi:MAG: hypothetical protein ABJG75_13090 [Roseobacter sp.]
MGIMTSAGMAQGLTDDRTYLAPLGKQIEAMMDILNEKDVIFGADLNATIKTDHHRSGCD